MEFIEERYQTKNMQESYVVKEVKCTQTYNETGNFVSLNVCCDKDIINSYVFMDYLRYHLKCSIMDSINAVFLIYIPDGILLHFLMSLTLVKLIWS